MADWMVAMLVVVKAEMLVGELAGMLVVKLVVL